MANYDGWVVIFEYAVEGSKKVDLALCAKPAKPVIFIEMKAFEHLLDNSVMKCAKKQLSEYICHFQSNSDKAISITILTDGQKWTFFHPEEKEDWQEHPVCELDFIENDIEEITECLNKYLNYNSIGTGEAQQAIKNDYRKDNSQFPKDKDSPSRRLRVTMPDGEVIDCPNPKDTFNEVIEKLKVRPEQLTFKRDQQSNIWEIRENLVKIGRKYCVPLKVERIEK